MQLVAEVTNTRHYHGNSHFVGHVDRFLIPNRTTWLYDGLNPMFTGKLDTVIEWEEGVRCHYRPIINGIAGMLDRDLQRVDPVRLTRAHAQRPFVVGNHDGCLLYTSDAADDA